MRTFHAVKQLLFLLSSILCGSLASCISRYLECFHINGVDFKEKGILQRNHKIKGKTEVTQNQE